MNNVLYIALSLKSSLNLTLLGSATADFKLSWAGGQVGAIPVFAERKDALAYVNGDESRVFEVKLVE